MLQLSQLIAVIRHVYGSSSQLELIFGRGSQSGATIFRNHVSEALGERGGRGRVYPTVMRQIGPHARIIMIGRVHSKKGAQPRAQTLLRLGSALCFRQPPRYEKGIAGGHDGRMMPLPDGIAQGNGCTYRRYPLRTPIPRLARIAMRP